jgi:hypothetical protein
LKSSFAELDKTTMGKGTDASGAPIVNTDPFSVAAEGYGYDNWSEVVDREQTVAVNNQRLGLQATAIETAYANNIECDTESDEYFASGACMGKLDRDIIRTVVGYIIDAWTGDNLPGVDASMVNALTVMQEGKTGNTLSLVGMRRSGEAPKVRCAVWNWLVQQSRSDG